MESAPRVLADFLQRTLVGEELVGVGKVNAVVAGEAVRRAADAHVHLPGSGFAERDHRERAVVPRTMESSTTTTLLSFTISVMRLSFTRTLKSRML